MNILFLYYWGKMSWISVAHLSSVGWSALNLLQCCSLFFLIIRCPSFYVEKPQTSALVTKGLLTIQLSYLLYFVKSLFTVHFSKKHVQSISLFTCRCFTAVSFGKKHFLSTHNLVIFSCLLTSWLNKYIYNFWIKCIH